MGEVRASVLLQNQVDLYLLKDKRINKKDVRRIKIDAMVDTGAVKILLPEDVVEKLGLGIIDKRVVVLADESKRTMNVAGDLLLTVCGRTMRTDCLVGPPGCESLLGQIVLEDLDLIVDSLKKTLTVRPESPYMPTLKLKYTDAQ